MPEEKVSADGASESEEVIQEELESSTEDQSEVEGDKSDSKSVEDIIATRVENETLKRQLAEANEAKNYWYSAAQNQAKESKKEKSKPADDEDDLPSGDEVFTAASAGKKEFAKILDRYLSGKIPTKEQIDEWVDQRAEALVQKKFAIAEVGAKLNQKYPELSDQSSELFKATQAEYSKLIDDPDFKRLGEARLLDIAAKNARLELLESGRISNETSNQSKQKEVERSARIAAQQGVIKGAGKASGKTVLTDAQKRAADQWGVSHEEYAKSLNRGARA